MAAYAEGLNILRHANVGKEKRAVDAETTPLADPELYQYDFDLRDIAEVWRRGSVIASWLLDLTAAALERKPGAQRVHRPRLRLGRGPLDAQGRDRRGRARAHPLDGDRRALRVARRGGLRRPHALGDALRVRRPPGEAAHERARSAPTRWSSSAPPAISPTSRSSRRCRRWSDAARSNVPDHRRRQVGLERSTSCARARATASSITAALDRGAFDKLSSLLRYVDGDYADAATFDAPAPRARRRQAAAALPRDPAERLRRRWSTASRASGCAAQARVVAREAVRARPRLGARAQRRRCTRSSPSRRSSASTTTSARSRCRTCSTSASPTSRSSRCWNRNHVDSVQITMAESFGVQGRGQLLRGDRRDPRRHPEPPAAGRGHPGDGPARRTTTSRRSATRRRASSRRSRRSTPSTSCAASSAATATSPASRATRRSRPSPPSSCASTPGAGRACPFFIRAGKCLPVNAIEVLVQLKRPPRDVFGEGDRVDRSTSASASAPTSTALALGMRVKRPGEAMVGPRGRAARVGETRRATCCPTSGCSATRMRGDASLFARQDAIEAQWRIVDPVLDLAAPPHSYEPGAGGPRRPSVSWPGCPAAGARRSTLWRHRGGSRDPCPTTPSRATASSATCGRSRWSSRTARSTGCAFPSSTRRASSAPLLDDDKGGRFSIRPGAGRVRAASSSTGPTPTSS